MTANKLTPELQAEMVALLEEGNYVATACAKVGISRETYYAWLRDAKALDASEAVKSFAAAVTEASATGEAELVKIIRASALEDWRAAAFLIERRHPKRWNERKETKLSGSVGVNGEATPAEARKLMSESFGAAVAPKDPPKE